jgi:hypothetical protein
MASGVSRRLELRSVSFAPERKPHWPIPVQAGNPASAAPAQPNIDSQGQALLTRRTQDPCAEPTSARTKKEKEKDKGQDKDEDEDKNEAPLDPSTFIHIVEDSKVGVPLCAYRHGRAMQFGIDLESSLRVMPDPDSMDDDLALNKMFITAKLTSGDSTRDVVVTGYSEVGKDKEAMAAQVGVAFQSAANVEAMILNMAYTVGDIVHHVYGTQETKDDKTQVSKVDKTQGTESAKITLSEWLKTQKEIDFKSQPAQAIDQAISAQANPTQVKSTPPCPEKCETSAFQRTQERLRLYQPEIKAISDFFLQPENLAIVEKVGVDVFWVDRNSLEAIAQQYKDNVQVAFDQKGTDADRAQALQDLLERTKLVYNDFGDFRKKIRAEMQDDLAKRVGETGKMIASEEHTKEEWTTLYEEEILHFSKKRRSDAFKQLKNNLATGSIALQDYQAKDGDRLTITVESLPSGASTGGIPAVFYITVKKYGAKIQWSPSLLFVRRLGVTDSEASPADPTVAPLNRINFAPSPGMTFGIAYFKRGNSGGDKFLRALAPGVGMNVTFMNFNDPSYDLSTQKFVNTTGANVQVGAGVIGSLFDNKLQVSYGWNLNVEKRRTYFGVGFGFIEVGKEVAKYVSK